MKCIILAAGYATRLYPLTQNFPKPLLPVGGRPILDWLIEDVSPEADEFAVVTNHKFYACFQEWNERRAVDGCREKIRIIDDGTESNETRLGAVKDIRLAATDDCDYLVMAGDNVLDFSLRPFIAFGREKGTSCVMCHEENDLARLRRTAVIEFDGDGKIISYEEKPQTPRGHYAVPPFYYYRKADIERIGEALEAGCGYDAPGSFAAWLSKQTPMHAWIMPGHRHDIGDMASYEAVRDSYQGIRLGDAGRRRLPRQTLTGSN